MQASVVTSAFIKTLNLEVGNQILMGNNAVIKWSQITDTTALTNTITTAQNTANSSVNALGGSSFPKLTKITSTGVYTGTLTADQITAGTISASKIKTNEITSLGAVTGGSFNLGNGKFQVSSSGYLTATGAKIIGEITATTGKIGIWDITATQLQATGGAGTSIIRPSEIYVSSSESERQSIRGLATSNSNGSYGILGCIGHSVAFPSALKGGVVGCARYSGSYGIVGWAETGTGAKAAYFGGDVYCSGSIQADSYAGGVEVITGSGTKYLYVGYDTVIFKLTADCTVYLPATSGIPDGTKIYLTTMNNYNANIRATSGRLISEGTSYAKNLDDNTNTAFYVKYNTSWYQLGENR